MTRLHGFKESVKMEALDGIKQLSNEITVGSSDSNFLDVSGYASVYGNRDDRGDVVHNGAFDRFIEVFRSKITKNPKWMPLLYRHRSDMVAGYVKEITSDDVGLRVRVFVDKTTDVGKFVASLIEKKKINGFSYHFYDGLGFMEDGDRHLTQMMLNEITVTPIPANELSLIQSFKERTDKSMFLAWKDLVIASLQDLGVTGAEAKVLFTSGFKEFEEDRVRLQVSIFDMTQKGRQH